MKIRPPAAIREAYADVLDGDEDAKLVELLRTIDAGYKAIEPPPSLRTAIRTGRPPRPVQLGGAGLQRRKLMRALILPAIAVIILVASVAIASGAINNLGKPTNALPSNPYFPLGGFHQVKGKLPASLAHQVLFISNVHNDDNAAETWPLVKALQQFGTLSGTAQFNAPCGHLQEPPNIIPPAEPICGISTFDLSHAKLHSSTVSLAYYSLVDAHLHCSVGAIPPALWTVFMRYAGVGMLSKATFCKRWRFYANASNFHNPVLLVGQYVQAGIETIKDGDFQQILMAPTPQTSSGGNPMSVASGLPFDAIQSALAGGKDPRYTSLVEDVNAETNTITALICHADGGKPAKVCGRPVIKKLLKHVK